MNPDRIKAYNRVAYEIKNGRMLRASSFACAECGARAPDVNMQWHHPDYSKPLEVVAVCRICHANIHSRQREAIYSLRLCAFEESVQRQRKQPATANEVG